VVIYVIVKTVQGGPLPGPLGVSDVVVSTVILAFVFVCTVTIAGGLVWALSRAVFLLATQLHRFVMGANHPSYVKEEFERTHESRRCSTCGGTYYVPKETPDEEVSAWN
jgi:hypothetical protein